nr:Gfo/Idh/MocA family oxidoreductase [uncultured Trichococcus sp.]
MNIAVIGLGSMGKRRIRLIKDEYPEITIIGVDGRIDRQEEVQSIFDLQTYTTLDEAAANVSLGAVIISTSPISHEAIIRNALDHGLHVFTEINLINDYYDEVMLLAKEKGSHLYLSSTFLHRKEIQFIENKISEDKQVTYRYHVGQYLPDWHPWESYKDFFVSNKKTNGCREIFAIELPWITSVFGNFKTVEVQRAKISTLELDYPDTYSLLVTHESGIQGTINVNIVSRESRRELQIIGEQTTINWNGTPDSLRAWSTGENSMQSIQLYDTFMNLEGYAKNIIEDAYLAEIKEYISLLKGEIQQTKYSFIKDKAIIDWINVFEEGI